MKINASYYSAIGGREKNEDAVSILEGRASVLYMVADGLGGHRGGDLAAQTAVSILSGELGQKPVSVKAMQQAIETANREILSDRRCLSMKTTIAALWLDEENAVAATVGDTRIYQFRKGEILFQSKDHSVAYLSALSGKENMQRIREDKRRNQLTRALGGESEVKADVFTLNLIPEDVFLICSDGFWEDVLEKEMQEDLKNSCNAEDWLVFMKKRIENRKRIEKDNHSAIAVFLEKAGNRG